MLLARDQRVGLFLHHAPKEEMKRGQITKTEVV